MILGHDRGRSVPLQLRRLGEGYHPAKWFNQFDSPWPVELIRDGGFTVLHDAGARQ